MNDLKVQPASVIPAPRPGLRVTIRADNPINVMLELMNDTTPVAGMTMEPDTAREVAKRLCIAADEADKNLIDPGSVLRKLRTLN